MSLEQLSTFLNTPTPSHEGARGDLKSLCSSVRQSLQHTQATIRLSEESASVSCNEVEVRWAKRDKVNRVLKMASQSRHLGVLQVASDQGRASFSTCLNKSSNYFTYSGAYLTFPQFRFALRARLNLLPTHTVQARCGKVIPDTRCHHCHLVPETLSHLVNHCLHSMGQIRERHNTVLERLIRAIPPPPPSMGDKYKEQPVPNTTGANCTRRSFRCHSGCLPCMTLLRRRYINKNYCDNPSIGSIVWRCSHSSSEV